MENPPFSWYLAGKMVIFHGYVSLPEGSQIPKMFELPPHVFFPTKSSPLQLIRTYEKNRSTIFPQNA